MNPIKGQFIKLKATKGPWANTIGCVLSVGSVGSKVSIMPKHDESNVCIALINNSDIEDYKP